jgi:hypothetical protein
MVISLKELTLDWQKCQGNVWGNFLGVDLQHNHFNDMYGVYVIWHAGQNPATVRVGQGCIRDRLQDHRNDNAILAYKQDGLFVTWASVSANNCDGVERYLAEILKPLVGDRFPNVSSIKVNSPWQ